MWPNKTEGNRTPSHLWVIEYRPSDGDGKTWFALEFQTRKRIAMPRTVRYRELNTHDPQRRYRCRKCSKKELENVNLVCCDDGWFEWDFEARRSQ
jgi:hypothetical protein